MRAGRKPVIILEVSPLAQGANGIATYIRGLIGGLVQLRAAGEVDADFKLLFLNPTETPPPPPAEGFRNVVLRMPRRLAQSFWSRFPMLPLDRFVPGDLFHGCSHVVPYTRCPAWVTMHDVSWRAFPESFGESQRSFNEKFCGPSLKHCLASGGGILSVSHFTASEVERHFGIPHRLQKVVHEATFDSHPARSQVDETSEGRAWLGLDRERRFLLCLGLVERRKNIVASIDAWEALRRGGMDAALAIVGGRGVGFEEIRDRIAASPWANDILLPGRAPEGIPRSLYSEAEATLFLSHYEGFGLPILESMAAGCPVLVSNQASLPEVWGPSGDGLESLVVDPSQPEWIAQVLARLMKDRDFRQAHVLRGRTRAAEFSWIETARKTWKSWEASLDRSSTSRTPVHPEHSQVDHE
ncbi:MAG: glycosyltransferase family 4 protein [Fibrobacteria bacterium]|nr:glycosyltransferase family 4 protein [Fibrobacteria bacterium]